MSYTSETPNLGLPQWILSDPPQMSDFNTAFSRIDEFAGQTTPVAKGGTGATTPEGARPNLGIGTQLWTGSWSTGDITVNNFENYKMYYLDVTGANTVIPVFRESSSLRGIGGYISSSNYGHILLFDATVNGTTLTYNNLVDISIGESGNVSFSSGQGVNGIYGIF